eukprot:CAMPEP_0177780924 /NCGR_PEP_ID=MMETSP0491_2-20121128/17527_1 /TAXON_ID=63592 /ORGANISM="Tetraselmis chuii, Strain PLY429" /LENGTH=275 /DNA_ID=CAMNT_0019300857 /DNA_START=90 /DNA_END=918 /DNA_ORIENTATION=-
MERSTPRLVALMLSLLLALLLPGRGAGASAPPRLSDERLVFSTAFGHIEMAFYPDVAPHTVSHILKLARIGGYDSNHFFRVDKGFVAQVGEVADARLVPLTPLQKMEAVKTVPLEVSPEVKHTKGVVSLGRFDDPHSGRSSFSLLLGDAPHLDMKYTIFGQVTQGLEVLDKMQLVETKREGIFVMPKERITIFSSYVYSSSAAFSDTGTCEQRLRELSERFNIQSHQLQEAALGVCLGDERLNASFLRAAHSCGGGNRKGASRIDGGCVGCNVEK